MGKPSTKGMTQQTLKGLSWMASGTTIRTVLQALVLVVMARLLTPEEFGLLATATIVIKFAENASFIGISQALVQRAKLTATHIRTGFTLSLLLGFLLTGVTWLMTPLLATFFEMEELVGILRVLVWVFPVHGISVIAEALLHRALKYNRLAFIEIISYVFGYVAVGLPLAFMGYGVWSLVTATIVGAVAKSGVNFAMQPHTVWPQLDRQALKDLTYLGGGFTLNGMVNFIAIQGDFIIVGRYLGAVALGFYSKAYNLMTMPISLFGRAMAKVLFSTMSRLQDEIERLSLAYRRGASLVALLTLPASVVFIVLAPEIIGIALGPQWEGAIAPFQVLALGMFLRIGYRVAATVVKARGAVYRAAWRQAIYAGAVIVGAIVGQDFGIIGVAWGVLGALALYFLMMTHLALRITSMSWAEFGRAHVPAIVLSVAVGLVAWNIADLLRGTGLFDIGVLLLTGIAVLACVLILIWLVPILVLGKDGQWWIQIILNFTGLRPKVLNEDI